MHVIDVSSVRVSADRQRRTMNPEKIRSLRDSIRRTGLIHAITVSPDGNGSFDLRAGGRRFAAIQPLCDPYRHGDETIPAGKIPAVFWSELTPLQQQEIEYEENAIRENLPWPEQVAAEARLHHLRSEQAKARGEVQTYTATAKEIKGDAPGAPDITGLRENVMLAPFLEDPDVKKASNKTEAVNIVRRKLIGEFQAKLAKQTDPAKLKSAHTLVHGSCLDVLPRLQTAYFDVIITDPPYGINAHKMQPMSGSNSGQLHEYEDTIENATKVWFSIFYEGMRITKPEAHLYMFFDFQHWATLYRLASDNGWDVWPRPLVWHKPGGGMLGDSSRGPRRSYELILYARKGDKRVRGVYLDTIIESGADTTLHAAAKPVSVYENLLRRSCIPGDRIIDPCCGSGPVFEAATNLNLIATGVEIVESHYHTALKRIS